MIPSFADTPAPQLPSTVNLLKYLIAFLSLKFIHFSKLSLLFTPSPIPQTSTSSPSSLVHFISLSVQFWSSPNLQTIPQTKNLDFVLFYFVREADTAISLKCHTPIGVSHYFVSHFRVLMNRYD